MRDLVYDRKGCVFVPDCDRRFGDLWEAAFSGRGASVPGLWAASGWIGAMPVRKG